MIKLFKPFVTSDIDLKSVLESGYIGQGLKVEEFESKLKAFYGTENLCTLNSGTSALSLAYRMLSIPSREAPRLGITPLTCVATSAALLQGNTSPVWLDLNPDTLNVDVESIPEDLDYLAVVHWGGNPSDLNGIKEVYHRPVIEDCAHAFGAMYDNKMLGNHGNICCFSFQAIKHLTTGDGGMIITPIKEMIDRAKRLRWYGIDRENKDAPVQELGYKYHMNDIAATIGLANIRNVNIILENHRNNSNFYDIVLRDTDGIKLLKKEIGSSCWLYTIKVENRQDFEKAMADRRIETGLYHKRNDDLECLKKYKRELPKLDSVYDSLTNIPVGWWISNEDREYIVDCIKKGW